MQSILLLWCECPSCIMHHDVVYCITCYTRDLYNEPMQVHITKPTWSNHHNIFKDAGVDKKEYRYYKPETKGLDFDGLLADLKVSLRCQCRYTIFLCTLQLHMHVTAVRRQLHHISVHRFVLSTAILHGNKQCCRQFRMLPSFLRQGALNTAQSDHCAVSTAFLASQVAKQPFMAHVQTCLCSLACFQHCKQHLLYICNCCHMCQCCV